MKVSPETKRIYLEEEVRVCLACGYKLGFRSSFLRSDKGYGIILICPEYGA